MVLRIAFSLLKQRLQDVLLVEHISHGPARDSGIDQLDVFGVEARRTAVRQLLKIRPSHQTGLTSKDFWRDHSSTVSSLLEFDLLLTSLHLLVPSSETCNRRAWLSVIHSKRIGLHGSQLNPAGFVIENLILQVVHIRVPYN